MTNASKPGDRTPSPFSEACDRLYGHCRCGQVHEEETRCESTVQGSLGTLRCILESGHEGKHWNTSGSGSDEGADRISVGLERKALVMSWADAFAIVGSLVAIFGFFSFLAWRFSR